MSSNADRRGSQSCVEELDDLLLEPVRQTVLERVRMFPAGDVRIERSLLGDKAGLLGGIALAASEAHETALVNHVG